MVRRFFHVFCDMAVSRPKQHHKLHTMRVSSKDSRGNETHTSISYHSKYPWVQSTAKRGTNSLGRVTDGSQILLGYHQEGSSLKSVMKLTEINHDRSPYAVPSLHDLLICT